MRDEGVRQAGNAPAAELEQLFRDEIVLKNADKRRAFEHVVETSRKFGGITRLEYLTGAFRAIFGEGSFAHVIMREMAELSRRVEDLENRESARRQWETGPKKGE